jgi:hypothetical protein
MRMEEGLVRSLSESLMRSKSERIALAVDCGDWSQLRKIALERDGFGTEDRVKVW